MNPQQKRSIDDFQEQKQSDEPVHKWTDEELLEAAKRIMNRLGIKEKLYNGKEN